MHRLFSLLFPLVSLAVLVLFGMCLYVYFPFLIIFCLRLQPCSAHYAMDLAIRACGRILR